MTIDPLSAASSRRQFLLAGGACGLTLAAAGIAAAQAQGASASTLRVIAYNVYECTGWPKDRALGRKATAEGQMPARFALELALHAPDIINFSESPAETVVAQIAERLGMRYVRFPSGGKWPGTLFSRHEIAESTNVPLARGDRPSDLFTRHWGRAVINLPGGDPLIVHSAHLHPSAEPEIRLREIRTMLEAMKRDFDSGRSMLLIGDLNHAPDTQEYQLWLEAGWVDTFARSGAADGLTFTSDTPKWRIDYVMAAGPIAGRLIASRPLFEGAFRVNTGDPQSFALSDHLPQLAEFKIGDP